MSDASAAGYVLVPGAGGSGWYWHLVVGELLRRGHRAVAVDLPGADPEAGLPEYRDLIVEAARALGPPVTLVAQSLGGFSAPLACEHVPVAGLVLINAMIPRPGETAGEWWDNVGWQVAAQAMASRDGRPEVDVSDVETLFFHDLPGPIVEVMRADPGAAADGGLLPAVAAVGLAGGTHPGPVRPRRPVLPAPAATASRQGPPRHRGRGSPWRSSGRAELSRRARRQDPPPPLAPARARAPKLIARTGNKPPRDVVAGCAMMR